MIRAVLTFAFTAVAIGAQPARAAAQQGAYRFEITVVGDSTIPFRVLDVPWVKVGSHGIAVDPAHRDVLMARVTVTRVSGTVATAVVTVAMSATVVRV